MLKRILIVDDNENHLEVIKETLNYFNFFIETLPNGKELMPMVADFKPDLVLLDMMLPGGDNGLQLCQKLKSNIKTRKIPVILMSGYEIMPDQFSVCEGFLYKPFGLDLLMEKIDELLGTHLMVAHF